MLFLILNTRKKDCSNRPDRKCIVVQGSSMISETVRSMLESSRRRDPLNSPVIQAWLESCIEHVNVCFKFARTMPQK